jgi:hypothetical protein
MRDILKVRADGSLLGFQKWMSRQQGKIYARGTILCRTPSKIEIPFSCFKDEINKRLFNENNTGERVKIIGNVSNWRDTITINVYRLVLANSVHDKAEFSAIGTLQEIREEGRLLILVIEAKNFFKGKETSHALDVTTNNTENFRGKLIAVKGRRVLATGIVRQISGLDENEARIICWLTSLDVITERKPRVEKQEAGNELRSAGADKVAD